jgi:hypothetical protein
VLLLIPFYGVGIALAFLVVGVIVRARESARLQDSGRRTVFLRGAIRIPTRSPRGE